MVVPAQAATPQSFYLRKECTPGCRIKNAVAPFDVFNDQLVQYDMIQYFSDSGGNMHMVAGFTLTSADQQDSISGMVAWVYHNEVFTGHLSFESGTGAFQGVHGEGEIGLLHWADTFYFSGQYVIAP